MTLPYLQLREDIIRWSRRMEAADFVIGTSGNVSARVPGEERFLITPSSVPYADITPEDVVLMNFEGDMLSEGRSPSIESMVHLRVYQERSEVNAVFHTHSVYASAMAALQIPIPAFLDELIPHVGGPVAVAAYGQSGSGELAENAVRALGDRAAALLANHGSLCVGVSLEKAFHVVALVERTARIYLIARSLGTPVELPEDAVETQKMIYDYLRSPE